MKTVVITGASRGIGRATAEKFLAEEWSVIGTSTKGSSFKQQNLAMYQLNLQEPETLDEFVEELNKAGKKIDVLINNAGIFLEESDCLPLQEDVLRKTLEVNLIELIMLTERLLPHISDGGHVINISSGFGSVADVADAEFPAYKISKVGVVMYARTLAHFLKQRRVIVSAFDPGWVKTDMGGKEAPRDPSEPAKELFDLATARGVDSGYFWYRGRKRPW